MKTPGTFRVTGAAAGLILAAFFILFLSLYALAILVIVKLFEISIWWGLAGLVAYLGKPRLNSNGVS